MAIMNTSRLEAFSDGVFAIAITLLVIELPKLDVHGNIAQQLLDSWPSFFAYAISFLLIGLVWANHHSMFIHVKRVDRQLLFLNTLLLASVAILPYPTALLADGLSESSNLPTVTFLYGIVLSVGGIFFNLVWQYITRRSGIIDPKLPQSFIRRSRRTFTAGPIVYLAAALVSLAYPVVGLVSYAALIIFFWLPPKNEHKVLREK